MEQALEHERRYVDPNLEILQRVEGGGPMKKIELDQMPRWLRWFGYSFFTVMSLMLVTGLIMTLME